MEADEEVLAVDQPAIPKATILKAQKQDQIVGRVLASKLEGQRPTLQDTKRELPGTKTLSRQWRKLKSVETGYCDAKVALLNNWCYRVSSTEQPSRNVIKTWDT